MKFLEQHEMELRPAVALGRTGRHSIAAVQQTCISPPKYGRQVHDFPQP